MSFIQQYGLVFLSGVAIGIIGTLVMQIIPEPKGFNKSVVTKYHRKFFNID